MHCLRLRIRILILINSWQRKRTTTVRTVFHFLRDGESQSSEGKSSVVKDGLASWKTRVLLNYRAAAATCSFFAQSRAQSGILQKLPGAVPTEILVASTTHNAQRMEENQR